jgi:hypothetical protein
MTESESWSLSRHRSGMPATAPSYGRPRGHYARCSIEEITTASPQRRCWHYAGCFDTAANNDASATPQLRLDLLNTAAELLNVSDDARD